MNANFKLTLKKTKKASPAYGAVEGITCYQWWYRVMHHTFTLSGVDISSTDNENRFKQTTAHLYKYFSTSEPYQLVDGAEETLREIRDRKSDNCSIGVLSNSDERLPLILGELGVAHFFFDFILVPLRMVKSLGNNVSIYSRNIEYYDEICNDLTTNHSVLIAQSIEFISNRLCNWMEVPIGLKSKFQLNVT